MAKRPSLPRAKHAYIRFFARPFAYEFIAAWFAAFGGTANAIRGFSAPEYSAGDRAAFFVAWLWAFAAGGGLVFTVCKIIAIRLAASNDSADGLVGAITTLLATMKARYRGTVDPRLRFTIYQQVGDHLEQVIDYVGDDRDGGKAGRKCNGRAGVIGAAIRSGEPRIGNRASDNLEEYVRELVNDWGYTEEEARKLSPESRSHFAIPLKVSNTSPAIGVLYIDAVVPGFFNRSQQITAYYAASAIAEYASRRYK